MVASIPASLVVRPNMMFAWFPEVVSVLRTRSPDEDKVTGLVLLLERSTCSFVPGFVTPIPTLPELVSVNFWVKYYRWGWVACDERQRKKGHKFWYNAYWKTELAN